MHKNSFECSCTRTNNLSYLLYINKKHVISRKNYNISLNCNIIEIFKGYLWEKAQICRDIENKYILTQEVLKSDCVRLEKIISWYCIVLKAKNYEVKLKNGKPSTNVSLNTVKAFKTNYIQCWNLTNLKISASKICLWSSEIYNYMKIVLIIFSFEIVTKNLSFLENSNKKWLWIKNVFNIFLL